MGAGVGIQTDPRCKPRWDELIDAGLIHALWWSISGVIANGMQSRFARVLGKQNH